MAARVARAPHPCGAVGPYLVRHGAGQPRAERPAAAIPGAVRADQQFPSGDVRSGRLRRVGRPDGVEQPGGQRDDLVGRSHHLATPVGHERTRVGAVEHGSPGVAVPFVGHERLEASVCPRDLAGQGLELGDFADVARPGQRPLEEEEGAVRPDRADGVDLVLTGPLRAKRSGFGDHRRRHTLTLASPDPPSLTASRRRQRPRHDDTGRTSAAPPRRPLGYGEPRWTSTWAKTSPRCASELRQLIDEHVPPDYFGAFTDDPADLEVAQSFCHTLAARGLLCVAWPEEWGGKGASPWVQTAVREEMWAHHEPRGAQYMGVNWVGPTIMRHGTPEQQRTHLPPIARGEVIWCQGFSEPNSGSDLASVQTAARRDGDGWFVSGQKIWTSYATMAQWCFLLTRTSRGDKKQQGLTIFFVPMSDPAIEVRPIASMIGPHHLNEVFFDELWVTEADVLGPVDEGWQVVQEVLAFERVGIARYARCERLLSLAPAVLGDQWEDLPEELRARWAESLTHCRRARLLAYRVVGMQQSGRVRPGDVAAYRIAVTRLDQHSAEVLTEITGLAVLEGSEAQRFERAVDEHWRYAQASTVASGSIEVQRMLLARALPVGMITELSEEATEYGLTARKVLESLGGDRLAQWAEAEPERRGDARRTGPGRTGSVGPESPVGRRRGRGRRGAVPQRGVLGGGVPGGRAAQPSARRRGGRPGRREPGPCRRRRSPASPCAGSRSTSTARRSVAVPRAGYASPAPRCASCARSSSSTSTTREPTT